MDATMMDHPLTTQMILARGSRLFAASRVAMFDGDALATQTYAQVADRAARLAAALEALGIAAGDRVGTFCWNSTEHLEAYLAVPAMGAVLHTVNLRLFPEQVAWIVDHAADRALIVDASMLDALAAALAHCHAAPRHLIVCGGQAPAELPGFAGAVHSYEALIAAVPAKADWPALDERQAAVVCYTSGTTGNPKGVVYSHRSIFLHSLASLGADAFGVCEGDRILMLPAMFHANAWGLPFSGWLVGADIVLPGRHLQPEALARIIALARPTITAAVPTILNDLLALHRQSPLDLSSFRQVISGGSAVSAHLIESVKAAWGLDLVQGWGMTETSPMCVLSHPPSDAAPGEAAAFRMKSGRPVAGVLARIVDDAGALLPEDGAHVGRLQLQGPWIARGYHREEPGQSPLTADGWLETGDVGSIDALGYVQVTDRTKDLIKSGGEWISSADLECEIARFPGVREVAVVAVPDPRWEERPLAIVVGDPAQAPDYRSLRRFLRDRLAPFMVPEYWGRLTNLPKTSVGKVDKKQLRKDIAAGSLPYERISEDRAART